ncbi:MAG: hypothetical protein ACI9FD_003592, partial [Gammaproteobacteria bacterium]
MSFEPLPVSHCFCFFARPVLGGGEIVHANILDVTREFLTAIYYDQGVDAVDEVPVNLNSGRLNPIDVAYGKTDLNEITNRINKCRKPLVFGGVSKTFYRILPNLDAHVIKVDILHAEGLDLVHALGFARHLNERVVITRALFKPIRRYYDELGFSTDYMGLIKPVSNYFPRHESTPEKDFSDPL